MSNVFEHKGYTGSIEVSVEDRCFYGKILLINDKVTYEADRFDTLESEFRNAVDDYLRTCAEVGKEPDRPFKGSFNVRISKELHRKAALKALSSNVSLNEFVSKAIELYVDSPGAVATARHDNS
ncbi:DNA repair protein HhH-GPD [Geomonas sp. Red276]